MVQIFLIYCIFLIYNIYIYRLPGHSIMRVKLSPKKKSLVLKLSDQEMEVLAQLAERRGTTKSGLLRQALRLYQSVDERMQQGERLYLEDSQHKEKMELVLL